VDRSTRNLFAAILVVILVIGGGAALVLGGTSMVQPDGRPTLTGVVVGVDAAGLTDVRGFTIRGDDGRIVEFTMGPLENGAQFPPGHLSEHQATAEPVRVTYVDDDGALVAVRIDDAPTTP
jgi:hypothetical protein